ncbi:MAG: hypothetical protein NC299_02600 [Lachnospiraceae bacterium]|nr:hypothetical protein [Ruminococcus sp.]MCM1274240.1 hypothetical protein [Lachnospiraceae bacterium]
MGRKSRDPEPKLDGSGNKTPQVMRLVEQNKNAANPVILAGKSRVPKQLRGREPLSRLMRMDLGEEFSDRDEDSVVVNLTEAAIEYEAPEILDRFNACSCHKCVEVFSRRISEKVPARFARITKSPRSGSRELRERMEPVRKIVLTEMIRELIGNKKRCFHDE